jgi:hypothetical protein
LLTALELVLPPSKSHMVVRHLEDITTLGTSHQHSFTSCHSFTQPSFPILLSRRQRQFSSFHFTSCVPPKCLHAGRTILDTFFAASHRPDFLDMILRCFYDFWTKEREKEMFYMNRKLKTFIISSSSLVLWDWIVVVGLWMHINAKA